MISERVRSIEFTDAYGIKAKQDIKNCPGFNATLRRALDDNYDYKRIAAGFRGCPQVLKCDVRLCYTPYFGRLTVINECLMPD